MKTINLNRLKSIAKTVKPFVGDSRTIPIINTVVLTETEKGLEMAATDLTANIRILIPCSGATGGKESVLIAGKTLHKTLTSLKGKKNTEIEITITDGSLHIKVAGTKRELTLKGESGTKGPHSVDDYPSFAHIYNPTFTATVNPETLAIALVRAVDVATSEQQRFECAAVHIRENEKGFDVAGSDQKRTTITAVQPDSLENDPAFKANLPFKQVHSMLPCFDMLPDALPVIITIDAKRAIFEIWNERLQAEFTVSMALLSGNFPPYEQVLNRWDNMTPRVVSFNAPAMLKACKGLLPFASETSRRCLCHINSGIHLSVQSRMSKAEDDVETNQDIDPAFDVALAVPFLIDAVASIEGDIDLHLGRDDESPVRFVQGNYQHILMPMYKDD